MAFGLGYGWRSALACCELSSLTAACLLQQPASLQTHFFSETGLQSQWWQHWAASSLHWGLEDVILADSRKKSTRKNSHQTGEGHSSHHQTYVTLWYHLVLLDFFYFLFLFLLILKRKRERREISIGCLLETPPTGDQTPTCIFLLFIFSWESISLSFHVFTII